MNSPGKKTILGLAALAWLGSVLAQTLSLGLFTVEGGGGTSAGGTFTLSGTAGQTEAGSMTGGLYHVTGGFWGPPDSAPTAHLVIDNADGLPYVQVAGTWTGSTSSAGYWGADYLHNGNTGQGTKSVTFIPAITTAGPYQVFICYTAGTNRAGNVPVDVTYSGGTSTRTLDQRINGSQWISLGTYNFAAGTAGRVTLRTTGTAGYVIADAIKLQAASPTVLLVDNTNGPPYVTMVGAWTASTSSTGYWGADYLHDGNTGKGSKSVTFTPALATAGAYQVFIWYTAGANRASNVPVDLNYSGGTTTVTLNQRINGSQWVSLGTFNFAAGTTGRVTLRTTGTDGYVIADAIKLQAAVAVDTVLDNTNGPPYVAVGGTWTTSTSSPGYWGINYLNDGNTGKGTKSVTFIPTLATAGTYQVFIWYTAAANRASNVPVDVTYSGGTTTVTLNQRINGSQWVSLGTYNFAAGTTGRVTLRTTGTDGYVIADALKWTSAPSSEPALATVASTVTSAPESPMARDAGEWSCAATLSKSADDQLILQWATQPGTGYTVYGAKELNGSWEAIHKTVGDGSVRLLILSPPWEFFQVRARSDVR